MGDGIAVFSHYLTFFELKNSPRTIVIARRDLSKTRGGEAISISEVEIAASPAHLIKGAGSSQ